MAEKWEKLAGPPVPHHQVGPALQDRADQLRDRRAGVLVVGVGVDHHVGAQAQRGVEAGLEGVGEAAVHRVADDVLHPQGPGHLGGPVPAAVVDHQDLDSVDALDLPGDRRQRQGQGPLFVVAGDLYDELHRRQYTRPPPCPVSSTPSPATGSAARWRSFWPPRSAGLRTSWRDGRCRRRRGPRPRSGGPPPPCAPSRGWRRSSGSRGPWGSSGWWCCCRERRRWPWRRTASWTGAGAGGRWRGTWRRPAVASAPWPGSPGAGCSAPPC